MSVMNTEQNPLITHSMIIVVNDGWHQAVMVAHIQHLHHEEDWQPLLSINQAKSTILHHQQSSLMIIPNVHHDQILLTSINHY